MESSGNSQARDYLSLLLRQYGWLYKVRPASLATLLSRPVLPAERRRIVRTGMGIRLYIDAFSHSGYCILTSGAYEPETVEIFKAEIRPGDICLDIGANEGILSALMGHLAGPSGKVISVEPQSRLRDIIEINLQINNLSNYHIFQNAFGGSEGETGDLSCWPFLNSGASSLVQRYKLGGAMEICSFISPQRIMSECSVDHFDFVKVDVEGFEGRVVAALLTLIRQGKVRRLLVDYHSKLLEAQRIRAADIHASVVEAGMEIKRGDEEDLSSYILYGAAALTEKSR